MKGKENSTQQADEGQRHLREESVLNPPVIQATGQEKVVWVSHPHKLFVLVGVGRETTAGVEHNLAYSKSVKVRAGQDKLLGHPIHIPSHDWTGWMHGLSSGENPPPSHRPVQRVQTFYLVSYLDFDLSLGN